MTCICKPWRGYHCAECPCQVAYEGRRAELADLTDDEIAAGRKLVDERFVQVSRKYRRIFQLPEQGAAFEILGRLDPEKAARMLEDAMRKLESEARSVLWALCMGETRELTPREFEAFRMAVAKVESGKVGP